MKPLTKILLNDCAQGDASYLTQYQRDLHNPEDTSRPAEGQALFIGSSVLLYWHKKNCWTWSCFKGILAQGTESRLNLLQILTVIWIFSSWNTDPWFPLLSVPHRRLCLFWCYVWYSASFPEFASSCKQECLWPKWERRQLTRFQNNQETNPPPTCVVRA